MTDRYRATEVQIDGRRVAAVIDDARHGERFCLIDPQHCFEDSWAAPGAPLARAQDIANAFNRLNATTLTDGQRLAEKPPQ